MRPCWDFETKLKACGFGTTTPNRAKATATMCNCTIYLNQRAWAIERFLWETFYGIKIENID